ncbi:MAG: hypothetical protein IPH84_19665 [Bacteroidales bacterium]|nr:hypothetical protein [Bacteroidales bacterium]
MAIHLASRITNSMNLTINPSATSFAGSNSSICEGSSFTLSTSNAANYTSLSWTSSGTGTFNNVSVLHPVYTPSIADIQSGNVNLTLTANSLAACQSAVSAMTLQITRQVVADAGPAASMCQSGSYVVSGSSALFYSTIIWTHTGTGTLKQFKLVASYLTPGLEWNEYNHINPYSKLSYTLHTCRGPDAAYHPTCSTCFCR